MPEIYDANFGSQPVTANGQLINYPSVSGTLALFGDVVSASGNLQTQITTISGSDLNKVDLSTAQSVAGDKTFSGITRVNNDLFSVRYIMGTGPDLSCIPVVGGQSVITTWWGLQLVGNKQSSVDYVPSNIDAPGAYGIIIPTQTPTITAAVLQRGYAGQTCDFINWQDSTGATLSEIRSNGNFNGHIDYVPAASGNWITPPTLIDGAVDDIATSLFSNQRIILQDDFLYFAVPTATPQGPAGFAADVAGTAAALTMVASTAGHYGVIQFGTGTTATGRAGLSLGVATVMPTGTVIYETLIMFPTLSVAAQEYTGIVGMSDTQTALPNNGVYFIYDRLTAGSNVLRIATAAGGTRTITNTSTTLVAGTWYKLKIIAALSGTRHADYYINGVLAGTISTNIPTLVTGIRAQLLKSVGTTASTMQVDYINIAMDIPAR